MIVVSNTSPLTNLAAIRRFDLLQFLYSEIQIAHAVADELWSGGLGWPGSQEVAAASWIHRHQVQNRHLVRALRSSLDPGESETIALALELEADLVLIDEREGTREARRQGLRVVGVVGMLLEAKAKGLVESVGPELDSLRQQAGFYLGDGLVQEVLQLAGEVGQGG